MNSDKRIPEIISIIFSAPFIALYVLLRLAFNGLINLNDLLAGILCLSIIPILLPLYYAWKIGSEWDYPERSHRVIPFLLIVLVYGVYVYYSVSTSSKLVLFIASSYFVNGLLAWIITLRYKISIHMIGIFGPATLMYLIKYVVDSTILYMIGVITGLSRYILNRHSIYQILLGIIVSVLATFTTYLLVYRDCTMPNY